MDIRELSIEDIAKMAGYDGIDPELTKKEEEDDAINS